MINKGGIDVYEIKILGQANRGEDGNEETRAFRLILINADSAVRSLLVSRRNRPPSNIVISFSTFNRLMPILSNCFPPVYAFFILPT